MDGADERPPVEVALHGDLKSFAVFAVPRTWITAPTLPDAIVPLLPEGFDPEALLDASGLGADPTLTGTVSMRLRGRLAGERVKAELHPELAALPAAGADLGSTSAGVGRAAPELLPLTWEPDAGDAVTVRLRVDRLWVSGRAGPVTLTGGRQPVSFGTSLLFTPLDVVAPFGVATVDTEYKPGVDALRVDVYAGTAGRITAVGAWAGAPVTDRDRGEVGLEDVIAAADGHATVGVTDLEGFAALARGDVVLGLATATAVGPVELHGEGTVTVPGADATEPDPFVRVAIGGMGRPTANTTVTAEGYVQTLGAADPSGYLDVAATPRFQRGEIWALGRGYASVTVAQQLTPLVAGSVGAIGNVLDPSLLAVATVSWSVADEATVSAGGYVPVGKAPDPVPLGLDPTTFAVVPPTDEALASSVNSEFGLYPLALFVSMAAYF